MGSARTAPVILSDCAHIDSDLAAAEGRERRRGRGAPAERGNVAPMTGEHVSGGVPSQGAPPEGEQPPEGALPPGERPPAVGDVLDGRYRLVDLLGRGGFGDVWRADELLPDGTPFRQVALKLLAPHVTDAASWVEEAKLLASFRHPSLVTIFATGVFQVAWPQPFVAMELLEGATLAEVLEERGPTPWRRVLAGAREAAGGLEVIH